jgi:hypothetical protein
MGSVFEIGIVISKYILLTPKTWFPGSYPFEEAAFSLEAGVNTP